MPENPTLLSTQPDGQHLENAGRRARRAKTPGRQSRRLSTLAEKLTRLLREALEADPAGFKDEQHFCLTAVNPLYVLLCVRPDTASIALIHVAARALSAQKLNAGRLRALFLKDSVSTYQPEAVARLEAETASLGIALETVPVYISPQSRHPGAALRTQKSRALLRSAARHHDDVVISPLCADEELQNFFDAWLTGMGPEGIAPFVIPAGRNAPRLLTPWRSVGIATLERYLKQIRTEPVPAAATALQTEVLPVFEAMRPGFRNAARRSIELTEEALDTLREVAREDLKTCFDAQHSGLRIASLLKLAPARQAWCLRAWFEAQDISSPEPDRLAALLKSIRESQNDSALSFRLKDRELRRWGSYLVLGEKTQRTNARANVMELKIDGECRLSLPAWHGELIVRRAAPHEHGIAAERLRKGCVEVKTRQGGEKLKLYPLKLSKNLKDLYAEHHLPLKSNSQYPLIWLDGELIFATGLGMEIRQADDPVLCPERLTFEFRPDGDLLDTL